MKSLTEADYPTDDPGVCACRRSSGFANAARLYGLE